MIKTPLSTMIGGAFWTPGATIVGSTSKSKTFDQLIKSLFANNAQGFAYDPNDLSTMFQDADGIVPVTSVGQPVGLIRDKSGRNNHAYQTTSASRPILRQNAFTGAYYLEFDGVDDSLIANSIDFTSTDKVSLFAGVHKLSDDLQIIAETTGEDIDHPGTFYLMSGEDWGGGGNGYSCFSLGTAELHQNQIAYIATYPAPDVAVLSAKHDISNNLSSIRRNGVHGVDGIGEKGAGNFNNRPLYIGKLSNSSNNFNGHIYSLIGVGRLTTDAETIALEKELAKRTGVTLSV